MSNNFSGLCRLVADPELKKIGENDLLSFRAANNCGFGERQVTNWFNCSLCGKRGVSIYPYLEKGKMIWLSGILTLRAYTNKEGVEKLSPEILISELDFTSDRSSTNGEQSSPYPPAKAPAAIHEPEPEVDDDRPF